MLYKVQNEYTKVNLMQILLGMHGIRSQWKRLCKLSLFSLIYSTSMVLATMLLENIHIIKTGQQDMTQELRKTQKKINTLATTPNNVSNSVFLGSTWSDVVTHYLLGK